MKKKLVNLFLVCISIFFALLLGEGIVRIFLPQEQTYTNAAIWKPDARLGWRHPENIHVPAKPGSAIVFRTDEHGYRVNAEGVQRSDTSGHNILVLGDSFLEAVQVENRNSISQILQDTLNLLPGLNTRFYNSGVAGWSPNHYFLEGKRVLEETDLKIDQALVFLYTGNDVITREIERFSPADRSNKKPFRLPRNLQRRELASSLIFPADDYLDRNSHLYALVKRRNRRSMTKMGLYSGYFTPVFHTRFKASGAWETTAKVCKKISSKFDEYDIPVKFVLIPTSFQVNSQVLENTIYDFDLDRDSLDIEQPNRILAELFARDSMILHDPLEYLRKKSKEGAPLYGIVDPHFNKEGHRAMADYLLPVLSDELKQQ